MCSIISKTYLYLVFSSFFLWNYSNIVLRAVNNALLDTYQLKSLDGLFETPLEAITLSKQGQKIHVHTTYFTNEREDNSDLRAGYDVVIRALGFKFDTSPFLWVLYTCRHDLFVSSFQSIWVQGEKKPNIWTLTHTNTDNDTCPQRTLTQTQTHTQLSKTDNHNI